jgi:hypothetical protein
MYNEFHHGPSGTLNNTLSNGVAPQPPKRQTTSPSSTVQEMDFAKLESFSINQLGSSEEEMNLSALGDIHLDTETEDDTETRYYTKKKENKESCSVCTALTMLWTYRNTIRDAREALSPFLDLNASSALETFRMYRYTLNEAEETKIQIQVLALFSRLFKSIETSSELQKEPSKSQIQMPVLLSRNYQAQCIGTSQDVQTIRPCSAASEKVPEKEQTNRQCLTDIFRAQASPIMVMVRADC